MSNKKAFTLIELLVVIAIIAILAAILFPVFAQAKAAAKVTASISNVKNITTASLVYTAIPTTSPPFPKATARLRTTPTPSRSPTIGSRLERPPRALQEEPRHLDRPRRSSLAHPDGAELDAEAEPDEHAWLRLQLDHVQPLSR